MGRKFILLAILGCLFATGCDDPSAESTPAVDAGLDAARAMDMTPDGRATDALIDAAVQPNDMELLDAVPADAALRPDLGPDLSRDNVPPPTERLVAGYAERPLGFPIGIGTVGYSPGTGARTPFASLYPGTNAQQTDLTARALVLRNAGEAVVLVRTDSIGIWQDMVRDVRIRLREEGRGDLSDGLIVGATHTHSSGGRIFDHFIGEIAVGPFLPGLYQRVRDAIVNAVLAADAAVVEARIGHDLLQVPELHSDRRCENEDFQDDTMGLIKVVREDGSLLALVVNYAMHATVLNTDDWTLSRDATGAVESGIESRLSQPAPVLYFQSWAGDMSPRTPEGYISEEGVALRDDFTRMDAIGAGAADAVIPRLDAIEVSSNPLLGAKTVAVPLVPEEINPDGSFDMYRFGGIYCVDPDDNCGPDARPFTPAELACVPIDETWSVDYTFLTAARIGSLGLVTLPGEPLTSIGVALRDQVAEATGWNDVLVLGYAQGYLAYLLHPDDFWMGGYEAASTLMGPGFGVYLIDKGVAVARHLALDTELGFEPVTEPRVPSLQYGPLEDERPLGVPAIQAQSTPDEEIIWVRWIGGGPVSDTPRVHLEHAVEEVWTPFTYPHGGPVDSGGPEIELLLAVEPSYEDALNLEERTFYWTARMPSRFRVEPSFGHPRGTFRFRIEGQHAASYELFSEPFLLGEE